LDTSEVRAIVAELTNGPTQAIAIGLDMAADERNWGLALLALRNNCSEAQLVSLDPHHAIVDGRRAPFRIRSSRQRLASFLEAFQAKQIPIALAVDVPFGWPRPHAAFTQAWSAESGCAPGLIPQRNDFEYRLTDLCLRTELRRSHPGAALFAVGADKIASAAFEWARVRSQLAGLDIACDFGLGDVHQSKTVMFETYPAAFVRFNYPGFIQYKSGTKSTRSTEVRSNLLKQLLTDYPLVYPEHGGFLQQACAASRSDPFDGFLCALSAWDYLRWKGSGEKGVIMTTPARLLQPTPTPQQIATIKVEGWILVRMPPIGSEAPALATRQVRSDEAGQYES
jgi:hypothetical protein